MCENLDGSIRRRFGARDGSKLTVAFAALLAMTVLMVSQGAQAEKVKLAVFPVNDTLNLQKKQRDYLYDVIREAASASAGSYIALIHEQKIHQAVKKNKGACDEDCALKSATDMKARIALVVELNEHSTEVKGVVKLLDTQENVLLTIKRFSATSPQMLEHELQGAVMFVLSAQFLPLSNKDKQALQMEQQNLPLVYARTEANQPPPPPSTPVEPTDVTPAPQPEQSYSNSDIAPEDENVNPRAYLITAIVTGTIGLAAGIGAGVFGVQVSKELEKKDDYKYKRDKLLIDYTAVQNGDMSPADFNQDYYPLYGITYTEDDEVNIVISGLTSNLNRANDAVVLNGIMAGVFGGVSLASLIICATFSVKYARAKRNARSAAAPRFFFSPVLSKEFNGTAMSVSF